MPGWWIGGRFGDRLKKKWAVTIDLTCEFPEACREVTGEYLLLPCWDGVPPTPAQIEHAQQPSKDENQDDEIQFFEFANVAMQMEFDREALDNKRANLARQRGNARSVLKRIGSRP